MSLFPLLLIGGAITAGAVVLMTLPEDTTKVPTTFYCSRCHDRHNYDHEHLQYRGLSQKKAKKSLLEPQESQEPLKISEIV